MSKNGHSNIVKIFVNWEKSNYLKTSEFSPSKQAKRLCALSVLFPKFTKLGNFSFLIGEMTNRYWDRFYHHLKQRRKDHFNLIYGVHIQRHYDYLMEVKRLAQIEEQRIALQEQRRSDRERVQARVRAVETEQQARLRVSGGSQNRRSNNRRRNILPPEYLAEKARVDQEYLIILARHFAESHCPRGTHLNYRGNDHRFVWLRGTLTRVPNTNCCGYKPVKDSVYLSDYR
jgi:hypothetical protein